jgi:hypothetical protein
MMPPWSFCGSTIALTSTGAVDASAAGKARMQHLRFFGQARRRMATHFAEAQPGTWVRRRIARGWWTRLGVESCTKSPLRHNRSGTNSRSRFLESDQPNITPEHRMPVRASCYEGHRQAAGTTGRSARRQAGVTLARRHAERQQSRDTPR